MSNCILECTVALVDPEPDSIDLLRYAIKSGLPRTQISEPKSGEALLESFSRSRPDAIVTRQKLLGKLDGIALVQALRAAGYVGPVIMISNSPELESRALGAGATEFLPYDRWSELPVRLTALISGPE